MPRPPPDPDGRKRLILTDTLGLSLVVVVRAAPTQLCDGVKPVLLNTHLRTRVRLVYPDGASAGRLLDRPQTLLHNALHRVGRQGDQRGFALIPRR